MPGYFPGSELGEGRWQIKRKKRKKVNYVCGRIDDINLVN